MVCRSADIKNAFLQMRILWWLQAFFARPAVLASEVGTQEGRSTQNVLLRILWCILFPQRFQCVSHERCFSVKRSRISARSQGVPIPLFSFVVTRPLHRCSVANRAWDPLASVGRMLTILGADLRRRLRNVHLARLIARLQKAGLDVRDISPASGSADVLGYQVSLANSRIRSVARTVSSVASAVGQWSSSMVTSLFWR